MAIIKCPECGREISDKSDKCVGCGFPLSKKVDEVLTSCLHCGSFNIGEDGYCNSCGMKARNIQKNVEENSAKEKFETKMEMQIPKKSGKKKISWKTVGIVFLVIIFIGVLASTGENEETGGKTTGNESSVDSERTSGTPKPTATPTPTISAEEEMEKIKEQATELNYKEVFRNPDDYIGKYFFVDVKILTVENGSWLSGYEKAYKSYTNDEYGLWFGDMIYLVDHREETDYGYTKILTDDIIRVWGKFDGLIETKNSLNGTKGEEMSLNVLYTELLEE